MVQLHQIKPAHPLTPGKRVGRGGKRGKTAGRGTKGQKARAGHRMRPELRDIIKKFPKKRGYRAKSFEVAPTPVNLRALETAYASGDTVSVETLIEKKLLKRKGRSVSPVKILATGTLTKKLTVVGVPMSASAKAAIEKAGGTIQ
jgi:large subunit ribosomal protein L15